MESLNSSSPSPRLWSEKQKGNDLPKNIYIDSYISDCQWHSRLNDRIVPAPSNAIRICSYNIHKWMYPSNKYSNQEDVLAALEKIDPDIIGFQEATNPKTNLWKDFEDIGYDYRTDIRTDLECPTAIISKLLVNDITPSQINKIASVGLFTSPLDLEFIVCVLHLDAHDHTSLKREEEIRKIIKYLNPLYPTILIGDFNALKADDYTEEERGWLKRHSQGYPLDFQTIDLVEKAGFRDTFDLGFIKYSTWSARRVDFIFTRGINAENIVSTGVFYTPVSDHIPLFADFVI